MEKSFLALKSSKAREAYVEAELVNGLAHQIRIVRQQRGWTQKQLASKLGTTQTTVSRLEDPSYGRYTIRTLLAVGKVFDIALYVRYMSFSKFMPATWDTRPSNFETVAYDDEADSVQFYTETKSVRYEDASKLIEENWSPNYKVMKIPKEIYAGTVSYDKPSTGNVNYLVSALTGIRSLTEIPSAK